MASDPGKTWDAWPWCDRCWTDRYPGRLPYRLAAEARQVEVCALCGQPTSSGIYVRMHRSEVRHTG